MFSSILMKPLIYVVTFWKAWTIGWEPLQKIILAPPGAATTAKCLCRILNSGLLLQMKHFYSIVLVILLKWSEYVFHHYWIVKESPWPEKTHMTPLCGSGHQVENRCVPGCSTWNVKAQLNCRVLQMFVFQCRTLASHYSFHHSDFVVSHFKC